MHGKTHEQKQAQQRQAEAAVPTLPELQQREVAPEAVPVRPDGPVETHELPSRSAPAFDQSLDGTLRHVLGADLKRKRAVLVADDVWLYSHSGSARGVRVPADQLLVVTHADAVYAASHPDAMTEPVTLSVIAEVWAD